MTGAPHTSDPEGLWSTRSNYANDGQVIMEPEGQFKFFSRGILQICRMFLAQLPPSFQVHIDREQFLRSITMGTSEGRISADDWTEGPTSNVQNPYADNHQAIQDALLTELYNHMLPGIPGIQGGNPYEGLVISKNQFGRPAGMFIKF